MANGFNVDTSSSLDFDCEACILAKSHVLPFPHTSSSINLVVGDVVVCDIWGAASTRSLQKHDYYITFLDLASRYCRVYFLLTRNQALLAIKHYHTFFVTQKGRSFRIFRVDNARELVLGDMKDFLESHGIIIETTAPYSSAQNGVAERYNRTIVERARAMLIDVSAPKFLWEEAVSYANFLRNVSPTRALSGITPYEAFWGKKPDISHVHQFGRACWVLVPEQRRTKLDATSERYMFTGIAENAAGFRYYVPHLRQILTSRNVLFPSSYAPQPAIELPAPGNVSGLEGESSFTDEQSKTETTPEQPVASGSNSELPNQAISPPKKATGQTPISVPQEPPRRSSRNTTQHNYKQLHAGTGLTSGSSRRKVVPPNAPKAQLLPPRDSTSRLSETSFQDSSDEPPLSFSTHEPLTDEPRTLKEVQSRPDWEDWKAAMDIEINQLHSLGTYTLEELPTDRKPVGCRWVFLIKRDPQGNILKYKARLVAQGFSQIPGQDFLATYAPVMRLESYRTILSIAAAKKWAIHQIDVVGAYLNGELEEVIYMRQPPGYEDGSPLVCRLHKALYGLKQAGRVWNVKFNDVFVNTLGYTRIPSDLCVYIRRNSEGFSLVVIHVDDSTITTYPPSYVNKAKAEIGQHLNITDLGEAKTFVGLQLAHDKKNGTITIHQTSYITKILERFGMLSSHVVHTPMDSHVILTTPTSESRCTENDFPYAAAIGSLMYAAVGTRPDIAHSVQRLSQYTSNFSQEHITAVKRVFRYLNGTRSLGITYGRSPDITLSGYTDADWGQDPSDRKSVSGYVFSISGGAISWSSKKQTSVALSTMEAEFIALGHGTKDALWLRSLLTDLGFPQKNPTSILCDNQAAIAFAHDHQFHARSKHIDIQCLFVRDHITKKDIKVTYVSTKDNCADIFTKGLARPTHSHLVPSIGMSAT